MGRFLKNAQLNSRSKAIQIPLGSSAIGPDQAVNGQMRFNQDNSKIEFYYNSTWNQVAKIGSTQLVADSFNGTGSQTDFTMSQAETDPTAILVTIGGVYQIPTTHYTVSGTTIHFTSAPPAPGVNPNQIIVIHNITSTKTIGD
jgi:hypothetical protein